MGFSDLSCYGSEIPTPNLDQLADNGIRYTQMYNTSKCYTTRVALMTGNYYQHSDREWTHTATLGEVLRPVGYSTAWIGKHHGDFNPFTRGFDTFSGFLGGAISFWNPGGITKTGKAIPGIVYDWAFNEKIINPYIQEYPWHATDAFTDWSIDWLDQPVNSQKPWSLYLAYNAPHWPLHAHQKDIDKFKGVYDSGYKTIRESRYKRQVQMGLFDPNVCKLSPAEYATELAWNKLSATEKAKESLRMSIHAAMVHQVDRNVGRVIQKLKDKGQFENTLILFLADNGASPERPKKTHTDPNAIMGTIGSFDSIGKGWANVANTPMQKWKATSHEGGINTPMIAHWPEGIKKPGRFYREPCHLIDVLPTCMELTKATHPGESTQETIPKVEGISLLPTFQDQSLNRKDPLYFQFGSGFAIHDNNWKLVRSGNQPWERYNLSVDRSETQNLAAQQPERVSTMENQWQAWYQRCTGSDYSFTSKKKKKK